MYHAHVICGSCLDSDANKPTLKQTFIRTGKMWTLTGYLITLTLLLILGILIILRLY